MSCEAHLEEAEDCEEEEGGEPPEGGKPPWVACWLHLQAKIYIISWSWHSLWVPWLCACQCSRRGPWRCRARTVGPWRRRPPCAGRLRKLPWCLPPGPPGRGSMGVVSICWCSCKLVQLVSRCPTRLLESVSIALESASFCAGSRTKITLRWISPQSSFQRFHFVRLAVETGRGSLSGRHNILNQSLPQNHQVETFQN